MAASCGPAGRLGAGGRLAALSPTARWRQILTETADRPDFWRLTTDHLAFYRDMEPLLDRFVRGWLLDMGAGQLAWRSELRRRCTRYVAADVFPTHPALDLRCDLQRPLPFKDAAFDTVFCSQVLEHLAEPWGALGELRRVLKPGGHLLFSVPFVYYLHGAPHDFYRFTPHGVRHLAERAGLEVVWLGANGGLAHTAVNVVSMAATLALWSGRTRPLVRTVTGLCTALARTADGLADPGGRFAQNTIAVLRRPAEGAGGSSI
jgi:SAM-dependent methyltransferase